MYAPKLRTWLSDEQRFLEALSYKIDAMADEAITELRAMFEKARKKYDDEEEEEREPIDFNKLLLDLEIWRALAGYRSISAAYHSLNATSYPPPSQSTLPPAGSK